MASLQRTSFMFRSSACPHFKISCCPAFITISCIGLPVVYQNFAVPSILGLFLDYTIQVSKAPGSLTFRLFENLEATTMHCGQSWLSKISHIGRKGHLSSCCSSANTKTSTIYVLHLWMTIPTSQQQNSLQHNQTDNSFSLKAGWTVGPVEFATREVGCKKEQESSYLSLINLWWDWTVPDMFQSSQD